MKCWIGFIRISESDVTFGGSAREVDATLVNSTSDKSGIAVMESEVVKNPTDAVERFVDDEKDLPEDQEFNLEGEFHEDDLESSGALVCSTPAPAAEIPAIVVDEAQEPISSRTFFYDIC